MYFNGKIWVQYAENQYTVIKDSQIYRHFGHIQGLLRR